MSPGRGEGEGEGEGLVLMVYDTSDRKRTWKYDVNKDGTPDLELAVGLGLSHSWFAGGTLYRWMGELDDYHGFDTWEAALTWLAEYEPEKRIEQIQFWGHGSPGAVWMRDKPLFAPTPALDTVEGKLLRRIAARLTPSALLWFRTCSTFAGVRGHAFAQIWSETLKCRVAGFTHVIGPWQSGLHVAVPGQSPAWPTSEGILEGAPEQPTKLKWSKPWCPRTVTCLTSRVPEGW